MFHVETFVETSMPVVEYYKQSNNVVEASRILVLIRHLSNFQASD